MRTLNIRLLVILLASALVLGVAVYFLHAFQVRQNAGYRLTMAAEAEEEAELAQEQGDIEQAISRYNDAVENLAWYINLVPDDLDALQKLGLLRADLTFDPAMFQKNPRLFGHACDSLERLLREDPQRVRARRRLLDLYLWANRHTDAKDHLSNFPEEIQNSGELLELLGKCQMAAGDYAKAAESFQQAVTSAPDRVGAYALLAHLLRSRLERPAEADNWMRKMVASNPESSQAQLSYSRYLIDLRPTKLTRLREHPILLDAVVPAVLLSAVQRATEALGLADDDPDASLLAAKQGVVVGAVRRALAGLDGNLAIDDPNALLLAMMRGAPPDQVSPEDLSDAKRTALEALKSELPADDYNALSVATKHGVLVDAMQRALATFRDPAGLLRATYEDLLADVLKHALRARELTSDASKALSAGAKPEDSDAFPLAASVLADALIHVLEAGDEPLVLRLTGKRTVLIDAVNKAIESRPMADTDRKVLLQAAKRGILVDALERVLDARELASYDRSELLETQEDKVLSRIVRRALKDYSLVLGVQDAEAVKLAARCAAGKRDYDQARKYIQSAIDTFSNKPHSEYSPIRRVLVDMFSWLADIETQAGRPDEAIHCLKEGLKQTGGNVQLQWRLASILIERGNLQDAQQAVEELRGAKYSSYDYRIVPPVEYAVGFLKARIEYSGGQWRAAIETFERLRPGLAAYSSLLREGDLSLARSYRRLGNLDKEQTVYRRMLAANPSDTEAKAGLTDVLLRSGQAGEAIEQLKQIYSRGLLSLRGQTQLVTRLIDKNQRLAPSARDWREVEEILSQVTKQNPESVEVPILWASLFSAQARERTLSAEQQQSPAEKQKVLDQAERLRARAESVLLAARKKNPNKVGFWNALVSLAEANKDWDQAEKLLAEADQKLGDLVTLRLARARYLVRRYEKDGAAQLGDLAKNLDKFSEADRLRLLITLSSLAQAEENWELAESFLNEADKQAGDKVGLRLARAQYLVRRYQEGAVDRLRALAEKTDQFSEEERLQLWQVLLPFATQMDDNEQAKRLGQWILQKKPNDVQIRFMLFELAMRSRDNSGMKEMLEEIETVEGKGPIWLYGQAVLLSIQADSPADERFDRAMELVDQARQLRPSWWPLLLLAAEINRQRGNLALALENYLQGIKLGSRNPAVIRRAVQLLAQRGRDTEALDLIRLLKGQPTPAFPEFRRWESRLAAQEGDFDRALKLARSAAADSDDYRDHVWLGQLLSVAQGRPRAEGQTGEADKMVAEAEQSLRHAVSLSDENAETWTALIEFLSRMRQTQKADEAIVQARSKIPQDQAALAVARWYEVLGRFDQAGDMYQAAIKAAPDDPVPVRAEAEFYLRRNRPLEAENRLKQIANGAVKAPVEDVNWARRQLATILVDRGGYQNHRAALALINKNLASGNAVAADRRLKAGLSPRDLAIQMLESLGSEATPEDQFRLARLYEEEGKWNEASARIRSLLGKEGNVPNYVATYVRWLLERNVLTDAELWLKKLAQLAPNHFGTTTLQAELLFRRKRYDQALDLVKSFVDKPNAQPGNETDRLLMVAETLERFTRRLTDPDQQEMADQYALEGENLLQNYVRKRPAEELLLAAFLARRGRIDNALEVVERAWERSDTGPLTQALSALLQSPAATEQQVQQAMKTLEAALQKYDRAVPLLLVLASGTARQKNYDQTEAAYREILQMDKGNVVAMNNLAVLLALRKFKLPESLELVNRAIKTAGPLASILDSRASVYMALGQTDKALADLKKAVDKAPSPVNYFHLAQAYDLDGRDGEATAALKKAVELGLKSEMLHPLELATYQKLQTLM